MGDVQAELPAQRRRGQVAEPVRPPDGNTRVPTGTGDRVGVGPGRVTIPGRLLWGGLSAVQLARLNRCFPGTIPLGMPFRLRLLGPEQVLL